MTQVILAALIFAFVSLFFQAREARAQLRQARRDNEAQRQAFAFALRELGGDPERVPQLAAPDPGPALAWRICMLLAAAALRSLTDRR
jgi:hypothetical protein